jgi:hypothetical protein
MPTNSGMPANERRYADRRCPERVLMKLREDDQRPTSLIVVLASAVAARTPLRTQRWVLRPRVVVAKEAARAVIVLA